MMPNTIEPGVPVRILTAGKTITGKRESNEDAYGILHTKGKAGPVAILFVADGLGGEPRGELASKAAVDAMPAALAASRGENFTTLFGHLEKAVLESRGKTTFTMMILAPGGTKPKVFLAWVGDSPGLVLRRDAEGQFQPVTIAEPHGYDNIVLKMLGATSGKKVDDNLWKPQHRAVSLRKGDLCIVASDGLDDLFGDTIKDLRLRRALDRLSHSKIETQSDVERVCSRMIESALELGSQDNCTLVLGLVA